MLSGALVKAPALVSGLIASVVLALQPAAAQDAERPPSNRILHQCEKKIGSDTLRALGPYFVGGPLLGGSYKAFKLSNTLQEKGISEFLKAHGVHHPKTIRKLIPIVKSVVRGKVFRGGTIVGITIGGGLIISRFFFGSGQTDRSDSGGVAAPRSDLHDNDNTRLAEIDKRVKEEFGDKYILAEFLLVNSIARYDGERKGDIVVYSRLQECAAEMQPAQTEKEKALASSADTMCLSQRTVLKCSLEQVKVRRVLNDILSRITVENDTISWNEGEFSEH